MGQLYDLGYYMLKSVIHIVKNNKILHSYELCLNLSFEIMMAILNIQKLSSPITP